ncbi:DUF3822 family protein [uncultured Eudoraea sp.]|uniref:DUF3822 family protein n=1 Tax=uncultured Eudoraea sp. TaxID=1035614 RepID=UPI002627925D|nr:DUF3822 family protein [uncultured Eudoraea sp.]
MTKKEINNDIEHYHKLSIQVSLNGLSFCIVDSIARKVALFKQRHFGKELSPYEIQKELKQLVRESQVEDYSFSEVVVVHRNNLFSLVPKPLFDKAELANYLKFNVKILANDLVEYDEIESYDLVNVYIPFVNINNYIFDLFGEFEFMHHGTVMVQSLLNSYSNGKEPICYVHVADKQMDIIVLKQKQLLFFNNFHFSTKEDFIYYLLFTLEQLKLNTETIKLRLFGAVDMGDELYNICYEFVQHISLFIPPSDIYSTEDIEKETVDFTVLNAL